MTAGWAAMADTEAGRQAGADRGDGTPPRAGGGAAGLPVPAAVAPPAIPLGAPRPAPRAHRRGIWLLGGALLLGAAAAAVPRLLGLTVPAEPVLRGTLVQSVVATGRVENPHRVNIGTQITGTVAAVPVERGQAVQAGQALILLDSREAQAGAEQAAAAEAQAEARLRQIRDQALPAAEHALRQAEATLLNARQQYGRTERLQAGGFATPAQLDEARRALDVAEAAARGAQVQVEANRPGGSEVVLAEAALRQARANRAAAAARLDYTRILAPAEGTLIRRDVEPGDAVQPGRTLMVLAPAAPTEILVQVDERNLGRVAVGQQVLAAADAYPGRPFPAEVAYINPGVDPQRASVEVRLRVPAPPDFLRQDMTVSVDITVAERAGALILPADALLDGPAVLRVEDGRARRRPVRLGLQGRRGAEVLEGLAEGELVIPAAAAAGVREGSRVRLAGQ